MNEYQDFIWLLFNKYLKHVQYIMYILISIGTLLSFVIDKSVSNLNKILVGIALLVIVNIGYILLEWTAMRLPSILSSAKNIDKDDI